MLSPMSEQLLAPLDPTHPADNLTMANARIMTLDIVHGM